MRAPGQVQRGSGEGSGESLGGFGAEPGQVQQGCREGSGEGLGAEPGQVQQGSRERSGEGSAEGLGGFGAEPRQVQQGSGDRRRFRKFRKALPQSRAGFNEVPEVSEGLVQSWARFNEVPEVPEGCGGEPCQVQRGSGEGSGEGSGRVLVRPGSTRLLVGSGAIPGVCRRSF